MAATARACPRAAARRSFGVLRRYRRGVTPTAAGGAASAPPRPELVESADVERVLYSEAAIAERVEALGAQLSQDYAERKPVLVVVLNGSFMFSADLVRHFVPAHVLDFVKVSSYEGTESTGKVKLSTPPSTDMRGKDVILIEDIVDTGGTIEFLRQHFLEELGAGSVATCTLLEKPARREVDIPVEYVGFSVPDLFVIGYGLDFNQRYRSLPYIGILKPEMYQ